MSEANEGVHATETKLKPKRSAFWWTVQILTALAILAILVGLAFPRLECGPVSSFKAHAATMANQLMIACDIYKVEYGAYPETSENYRLYLILNGEKSSKGNFRGIQFMSFNKKDMSPNGEILDPWKTPYRIVFDDKGPLITSAGKDKIFGTKDDIDNRK